MTTSWPELRPGRLAIGVLGAGRVGAVLGAALQRAGHRVIGAVAVSEASRERAARLLPGVPLRTPHEVVSQAGLLLLAVPDDELPALVAGLAATAAPRRGLLVVHTSGRHGVDVLAPLRELGCLPLALHPAMTLTGATTDIDRLSGARFGVSAPESLRPVAEALVIEMGAEPVWLAESDRALYHAALAHASNHLVTLVRQSVEVLARCGVAEPERLLAPLIAGAVDNVLSLGDRALTGPVSRGDAATLAAHVAVLDDRAPDVLPAYLALARSTAAHALAAGRLDRTAADRMLDLLAGTGEPGP